MARVHLEPLTNYPFATTINVRTTDLNYGGHLGNDRLLSLVHEASAGFRLFYRMTRPADGGDIALVGNSMVCFDYAARRIARLPDVVRALASGGSA